MKNKIDEALEYAMNYLEEVKIGKIRLIFGVCYILRKHNFEEYVIDYIDVEGRKYLLQVLDKYPNLELGEMWWFQGDYKDRTLARLDVLKLIRDERIQGSKELEG